MSCKYCTSNKDEIRDCTICIHYNDANVSELCSACLDQDNFPNFFHKDREMSYNELQDFLNNTEEMLGASVKMSEETTPRRKISEINKDMDKLENFELTDKDIKELNEVFEINEEPAGYNHIQMSDVTIDTGETQSHPSGFTKHDGGKLRYDLVPVFSMEKVVKVLTHGSKKYDDNNWVKCPSLMKYFAAALRHMNDWKKGEDIDTGDGINDLGSGESHLANAVCCLLFMMEIQDINPNADDRYIREYIKKKTK